MKKENQGMIFIIATIAISVIFLFVLILANKDNPEDFEQGLIDWATELEMDTDKFLEDYKSDVIKDRVAAHKADGLEREVTGTPSVFINGDLAQPAGTYEEFKGLMDTVLSGTDEADLPVELEIFSDYQCPFCASFFPIVYQVEVEYEGLVNVTHKHFPLDIPGHDFAERYAYAAEAAREQGMFLEFSTKIFEEESGEDFSFLDSLGEDQEEVIE